MRHRLTRAAWLGLVALGLALAACQPLPQPFQPGPDETNALIALKGGGGVALRPPYGLARDAADAVAHAVLDRFTDAEIPATLGSGNRGSHVLFGDASVKAAADGGADLTLAWVLTDPAGAVAKSVDLIEHLPPASSGALLTASAIQRLAGRTVGVMAGVLTNGAAATSVKRPGGVVVWSADGAPGDGSLALKRAMEAVLGAHGVPVVARTADADLTVLGAVELGRPTTAKTQTIAVRWSVFGADGAELGVVSQNNVIPAGSLDQGWGPTALDVALAAWDGVAELLRLTALGKSLAR